MYISYVQGQSKGFIGAWFQIHCLPECFFSLSALFARHLKTLALAAENSSANHLYRANAEIPDDVNLGINSTIRVFPDITEMFLCHLKTIFYYASYWNNCNHLAIV